MRLIEGRNRLIFAVVALSFVWNISLLVGVILNLDFSHTRAAGGQFTDFPTVVRTVYVLQLVFVAYQFWLFKALFYAESIKIKWLPKLFVAIGVLGILFNALSRSSDERWNVIPAAVITWGFWYCGVKGKLLR